MRYRRSTLTHTVKEAFDSLRRYASFETDPERKLHLLERAQELHNADHLWRWPGSFRV
jgi:hypothetical protein